MGQHFWFLQEKKGPPVLLFLSEFENHFSGHGTVLLKIQISSGLDALGLDRGLGVCFRPISGYILLIKRGVHWAQLMILTSFSLLTKENPTTTVTTTAVIVYKKQQRLEVTVPFPRSLHALSH